MTPDDDSNEEQYAHCDPLSTALIPGQKRISMSPLETEEGSARKRDTLRGKIAIVILFGLFLISVGLFNGFQDSQGKDEVVGGKAASKDFDILLIIGGGYKADSKTAEVMSMDDEKQVSCDVMVPDLPMAGKFGSSFKFKQDLIFCSGFSVCIKHSQASNSWKILTRPSAMRRGAATIQLGNYVLITGGRHHSEQGSNTTDLWKPEREQFEVGPPLPIRVAHHCIARVNDTHALSTGGYFTLGDCNKKAFMFNMETEKWTEMESMRAERSYHSCGLVDHAKVVVAGGYDGGRLSSVEVFDLKTQTWSIGPSLSHPLDEATSVQLEHTFLVIGGRRSLFTKLNTVYEYDKDHNVWQLWTHRMRVARSFNPAVYKLPASYLGCRYE